MTIGNKVHWKLNTSNQGKLQEFRRFFAKFGATLENTSLDLKEIDADPISVISHKATQVPEGVLVEDTLLEVEGAEIGIHVKWLLGHLKKFEGKKAEWQVFLAYRSGHSVFVYEGVVAGRIVSPRGEGGFGFDPFFIPEGSDKTLAEEKTDSLNARAKAVEALLNNHPKVVAPALFDWQGKWQ